jgi:hypothetical protein
MLLLSNAPMLQISNIKSTWRDAIFETDRRREMRRHWEEARDISCSRGVMSPGREDFYRCRRYRA